MVVVVAVAGPMIDRGAVGMSHSPAVASRRVFLRLAKRVQLRLLQLWRAVRSHTHPQQRLVIPHAGQGRSASK